MTSFFPCNSTNYNSDWKLKIRRKKSLKIRDFPLDLVPEEELDDRLVEDLLNHWMEEEERNYRQKKKEVLLPVPLAVPKLQRRK